MIRTLVGDFQEFNGQIVSICYLQLFNCVSLKNSIIFLAYNDNIKYLGNSFAYTDNFENPGDIQEIFFSVHWQFWISRRYPGDFPYKKYPGGHFNIQEISRSPSGGGHPVLTGFLL